MTAIVNTDFMRKRAGILEGFQDIVNELTNIINLSRTLTNMSFFLQDARMILLSQMPHNWRKGRRCNRIPETDRQNGVPIHRFIFKTGICHRLSATSLIQRIIDVYSQTFQ